MASIERTAIDNRSSESEGRDVRATVRTGATMWPECDTSLGSMGVEECHCSIVEVGSSHGKASVLCVSSHPNSTCSAADTSVMLSDRSIAAIRAIARRWYVV